MLNFTTPIPLSIYIHLPWCVHKCPYCDFNSHAAPATIPETDYVAALLADLDAHLPHIWGRQLVSIFFGGGTPSLFSPQAIEKILQGIYARLRFGPETEITLEANPGTIDETHFQGFRQAGINRLSLGIQSLQSEKLKHLGRIHDRDRALRAIEAALQVGFTNFNLDFMHGLPEQSLADALHDLQDGLSFNPPHLSWYQLTIEPNTLFYQRPPALPHEDILISIQDEGKKYLAQAGMQQYEVSAYAKPGHECRHNRNYWEFGDYLGIGAGAHSKITHFDEQKIVRHWQIKHPTEYLKRKGLATANTSILNEKDIIFEFMLNALRLTQGISCELFMERTGLTLPSLEPMFSKAIQQNLLTNDKTILQPTALGQRFLNNLVGMFLP